MFSKMFEDFEKLSTKSLNDILDLDQYIDQLDLSIKKQRYSKKLYLKQDLRLSRGIRLNFLPIVGKISLKLLQAIPMRLSQQLRGWKMEYRMSCPLQQTLEIQSDLSFHHLGMMKLENLSIIFLLLQEVQVKK